MADGSFPSPSRSILEELFSRSLSIIENLRQQTETIYDIATSITDEITNDVGENLRIPGIGGLVEAAQNISSPLWRAKEELDALRSSIEQDYRTYTEQEISSQEDVEATLRTHISNIENLEYSVTPVLRSAEEALEDVEGQLDSLTRRFYERRNDTWAERLGRIRSRVSETREEVERLETRARRDFEEPKEQALGHLSHIQEERPQEENQDDSSVPTPQASQAEVAPKPVGRAPDTSAETEPEPVATVQEPVAPKRVEPLTSSQDLRAAAAQRQANQATVDESTAQNTSETPSITPDDLDQAIKEFQGDQAKSTPPTPTPNVRAPLSPLPTPSVARSATAAASEQAPSDDTIELTDEGIVAEDAPLEESDDLAAAIEEFQAKRVVTPSPLPQRPAAQTQAAPTNDIEELTEADTLPDEAPAKARAETATAETESGDLAAAIEELQAKQALSEQSASAQLPQNESISPLPKAPETPSIRAERTRLREAKTQAESRQRLLAAYNERLQTGSLKILHERYPKQERAWRSLSKTLGGSVDAFALVPPEARSQIHLQAVIETRAAFPDLTEVALSALLDDVAREQMAALQQNALMQAVAAGAEATLTAQSLAHLGMGRALVQVAQQTLSHADALRQNETRLTERGTALRQGRGAEASEDPAEADRLRAQQQQDANARHGLQIALRASLGNLETLAAGAQAAEQAVASRQSPDQVALLLGETLAVAAPQHASATPSMGRSSGDPTTPEAFHAQQASALRSAQARSAMQRIPTTRGSRTAARSSLDVAGDTPPDPLLQLPQEPNSPQASFSRAQRAMTERQRQFLGTARRGSGGGYEAMFGLAGAGAMTSDTEGDGDTPILEEGENVYLDDVDLREQAQAEELAYQQQEARQQEAQEQAAAEEEARPDQASPQDLMNKADTVQKIAKNPAVQKLLTGSGMALTAVLAIFIVILIILWLNLRLIAPKEGSLLRKPLSGMGTFGVILLDIATAVIVLISTLITAAILFLPIAPFAFALGAVPPSLQSVFMTGFNWVTTAIFR